MALRNEATTCVVTTMLFTFTSSSSWLSSIWMDLGSAVASDASLDVVSDVASVDVWDVASS